MLPGRETPLHESMRSVLACENEVHMSCGINDLMKSKVCVLERGQSAVDGGPMAVCAPGLSDEKAQRRRRGGGREWVAV